MWFLGVQIARYFNWCGAVQPRLPRWFGPVVFVGTSIIFCVLIAVLPYQFGGAFFLLGAVAIAPALLVFNSAHAKYWKKIEEQKSASLKRTLKVREMILRERNK